MTTMSQTFPKQALVFMCLLYKPFENPVGKGEIARNEQFLLFPQCFLPVWRVFFHYHQIKNCCLQSLSLEEYKTCCLLSQTLSSLSQPGRPIKVGNHKFSIVQIEVCKCFQIGTLQNFVFW